MSDFERLVREYAKGKIRSFTTGKPESYVNYLIFAYLGRLVLVIDQYQRQQIVTGAAIDQFLELASLINQNTGETVVDKIYKKLRTLANDRLDELNESLSVDDRTHISAVTARTVPI